jgi:DNA-binding IclR family transcriptional regulator
LDDSHENPSYLRHPNAYGSCGTNSTQWNLWNHAMLNAPSQATDNRSLVRGLEILRAFKPGIDLLSNSELADRTGLPRSTVSRLTGTLVRSGFLQHDARLGGYRLHATLLGLAHAMRSGSHILTHALDPMQSVARQFRIDVGLALPDQDDMIYLDALRFGPRASLRKVVSGQRVPIALTSLGHAFMSSQSDDDRQALLARLRERHVRGWTAIAQSVQRSIADVQTLGYCAVSWQPQVVSLATPLLFEDDPAHVLNVSLFTDQALDEVRQTLAPVILRLKRTVLERVGRARLA